MGQAAKKIHERPKIHEFHDHIEFLGAWLTYLKSSQKGFSLRSLAKTCGLAVGYLPMCLSRKRRLSHKALMRLLPELQLSRSEKRFFELLWTIGESENPEVRLKALSDLQKFDAYQDHHSREIEVYRYLTKWYYPVIREMAQLKDFIPEPEWIQSRLHTKIPLDEVREALQFLTRAGFLVANGQGQLRAPEKNLDCQEGVYKISLGQFHRQILGLAQDALENTPREQRLLLGHTFAIAKADFSKVQEILKYAQKQLEELSAKTTQTDEVYHVELAALPMTQQNEGEKK